MSTILNCVNESGIKVAVSLCATATCKQVMQQQVAHITAPYCAIRPDQQRLCQLCQIILQTPLGLTSKLMSSQGKNAAIWDMFNSIYLRFISKIILQACCRGNPEGTFLTEQWGIIRRRVFELARMAHYSAGHRHTINPWLDSERKHPHHSDDYFVESV